MTLRINRDAGKGDRRRATQDDNAYRSNYDLIFGKDKDDEEKYKVQPKHETIVTDKSTWTISNKLPTEIVRINPNGEVKAGLDVKSKVILGKPNFVSIKDAPDVLNLQDKAMWVIGYNEAIALCNEYYKEVW